MCAERCWLSREREGAGDLLRLQPRKAMKPRGDAGNRQPVCVYTNTHMCTQVRQLCLDRAPLSVTFFAEVLPGSECSHTFSSAFSPPPLPSFGSINDIHLLPISWRFRFHQVSDGAGLCFLQELDHSSLRHNAECLSDSPHGRVSVVSCLNPLFHTIIH